MSTKTKQWFLHVALASLAAGLASLVHASESGALTHNDLLVALQTALAYLTGAVLRSPRDARAADALTRRTD